MKITAGLGSIDEYIRFAEAGADEFFCGYVPYSWAKKYGTVMPLNRREVFCYNVQLGSYSELEILSAMIKKYGKPVHLTFNSLYYIPQQYPERAEIIHGCMKLGFHSYIIADPALILYLRNQGIDCNIHLSGETGEINSHMIDILQRQKLKRIIFHRKNTFEDMQSVIHAEQLAGGERVQTEFEAFVLNEMCQFSGAFCNSLHCDEMGYLCRVPYHLEKIAKKDQLHMCVSDYSSSDFDEINERELGKGERYGRQMAEDLAGKSAEVEAILKDETWFEKYDDTGYLCGETGCGLCALYQLQKAGITHLKLVGRGNYTDFMEKDIRNLRQALNILDRSFENIGQDQNNEKIFQQQMKQTIFPKGCSENCYYR